MKPSEFARALAEGKKFIDTLSGEEVEIYGAPDITGNVYGKTSNGQFITVNAKNLELSGERSDKTDTEKLREVEGNFRENIKVDLSDADKEK